MVLVLNKLEQDGVVDGEKLTKAEIKDLNRGRTYLRETADRHGTEVFSTVKDAVRAAARRASPPVSSRPCRTVAFAEGFAEGGVVRR